MKTAVAYARYSTDIQKDTSIEDQLALCERIAARDGFTITKVYTDRAKSSATMFDRDGLLALMKSAQRREFRAVITECPDRLSRDIEDLPAIYKRLTFAEIKIHDLKGEVTGIDIGIRGIMGPIWMKDLANKVRRGMDGRVRKGLIPGTLTYGYRLGASPGVREIDEEHAEVVRRIFREYAAGRPPRQIAFDLSRDGIKAPRSDGGWNVQTISGKSKGRAGMIGCSLYAGRLVWNVNRSVANPHTGRKVQRPGKPDDLMETEVPHLRIIDQDLFDRAQEMLARRTARHARRREPANMRTAQEHLLAGLLVCETCNGPMVVMQTTADDVRVRCSAAHNRGACDHRKSYSMGKLERVVLDGMKDMVADPQALFEYTKTYHARWAERAKETRADREKVQREVNRLTVMIDRYVSAIGESDRPAIKGIMAKLDQLETERVGLQGRLDLIDAESGGASNVVSLHPAALDAFRQNIEAIHDALSGGIGERPRFRAAFRNIFERFVVHPTGKRRNYEVTPYARLSAILGVDLFPKGRTAAEMLAEQGVNAGLISGGRDSQFCQTSLY
jgi:DNA invertase Pin-like site-specific DNA recombinase